MNKLYICVVVVCILCLPACSEREENRQQKKVKEKTALTIIRNDDCLNCHNIEDKSVGPTYVQISQKYEADFSTISRLANKIIEGGGGMWGSEQMTKHPFLEKKDAKKIVRWIFSLNDSTVHKTPIRHQPTLKFSEVIKDKNQESNSTNGLEINVFAPSTGSMFDLAYLKTGELSEVAVAYSGRANIIHFTEQSSFQPITAGALVRATGNLHIEEKGKYFFKLVKEGPGRVFIDGDKIINENDDDTEVLKEMQSGTYPIMVEYVLKEDNNVWSLQWIPPDEEYYSVIPNEVFSVETK
jgi:cytochrome c551/c552